MSDKIRPPMPTRPPPWTPPKIPTRAQWRWAIIPAIAPPIPDPLKPALGKIEDDLAKYEQAFTPMAKRNLAAAGRRLGGGAANPVPADRPAHLVVPQQLPAPVRHFQSC